MNKSIFISREISENSFLATQCREHGLNLMDIPMISIEGISFDSNIPLTDWIFFSSRNCVHYFFKNSPQISSQKFAAIGPATCSELSKYASVAFEGDPGDPQTAAEEFKLILANRTVLFPVAEGSLRTAQKVLAPKQVFELVCYQKLARQIPVGFPDILIFSSPSNVEAFLGVNQVKVFQKIIAFGNSTRSALLEKGIKTDILPENTSPESIWKAINQLLGS